MFPDSKPHLVIISSFSCSLTPVFRSPLSTSTAGLAPAHLSTRPSGKILEVTHVVPGLLPHSLGIPALHAGTTASEACLLPFDLALRVCFGGPGAVEGLVGLGRLYISSYQLGFSVVNEIGTDLVVGALAA